VKWCLVCHVGQISPVEVQHSLTSAELTGSLGRGAVLKMVDLGCSEDAICHVDGDPIPLKLVEEPVDIICAP
jgi:hypothetical protein